MSASVVRPAGDAGSARRPIEGVAVDRFARWLLAAVVLDLVVTRFIVRLAIFIPKGEPWATLSGVLGRIGAATDVLVPIVGVLVLAALLAQTRGTGRRGEPAMLAAVALVALSGFALVVIPTTPGLVLATDLLIIGVAAAAGLRSWRRGAGPVLARMGIVALAVAIALLALARAVGVVAAISTPVPGSLNVSPTLSAVAQLAFVIGAGLIGVCGIVDRGEARPPMRRWVVLGAGTALIVVLAWVRAPAAWDSLMIWSLGLSGAVPVPIVALAFGLVVAGLAGLHRRAPGLAVGASIVLASGIGLAASGLVLAGLLGLIVAASDEASGRDVTLSERMPSSS